MNRPAMCVAALVVAFLAGSVEVADACTCVRQSSCQTYARASLAFVGDVVSVDAPAGPGRKSATFRVVRLYKGAAAVGQVVTVSMPPGSSASCSLDVAPGKRYVMLASGTVGSFTTGLCHGSYTIDASAALPDLPPPAGRVTGEVRRYQPLAPSGRNAEVLAGVVVWVVTPDGRIEAKTDAEGRFTLTGVPLGPRRVRATVAPGEAVDEPIHLEFEGDCAEVYAYTAPTGRLIGAVLDSEGKPVKGADVSVLRAGSQEVVGRGTETGPSGSYIIDKVEPGKYIVSVGTIGAPTNRYPYVPVFHPGIADRASAEVVTIGADPVRLPATRLLPPVALASIAAEIVCRDGTIPASAHLSAQRLPIRADHFGMRDFGSTAARDGRATIRVVAGHRYLVRGVITVKVKGPGGVGTAQSWQETEPVEVDPAAPPSRLVLRSQLEKCGDPEGVPRPGEW